MNAVVDPFCSTLLLCDHVHKDGLSNKHSAIGIFNFLKAQKIPTNKIHFGVLAILNGGRGKCEATIRLIHSSDYEDAKNPVVKIHVSNLTINDPLKPVELGFNLTAIFKKSGTYYLQLFANTQLLMERTFYVIPPVEKGE